MVDLIRKFISIKYGQEYVMIVGIFIKERWSMRIFIRCDSLYKDDTDECKECEDGGELIPLMEDKIWES